MRRKQVKVNANLDKTYFNRVYGSPEWTLDLVFVEYTHYLFECMPYTEPFFTDLQNPSIRT